MTAYALRLENGADTAPRVRVADALALAPADPLTAYSGIRPATGAGDVTVDAGTMRVTVQPFVAWVQGGVSAVQGGYPFVLDEALDLTLGDGHPTLARIDTVAAVIHDDPYDGSGSVSAAVEVVVGTAGAGAPALPTNALPLYDVEVPAGRSAGTGGLSSANLKTDRRAYVDGLGAPPAGSVMPYAGSTAPAGWLLADGRSLVRAQYPRLYEAIGTTYGAPDGTTFNLPNLKGRVPVGQDTTQAEFNALGEKAGAKTHTLSVNEMPAHNHGGSTSVDGNHTHPVPRGEAAGNSFQKVVQADNVDAGGSTTDAAGNHSHTIGTQGGGAAHNNLQPYIVLQYLIKF